MVKNKENKENKEKIKSKWFIKLSILENILLNWQLYKPWIYYLDKRQYKELENSIIHDKRIKINNL